MPLNACILGIWSGVKFPRSLISSSKLTYVGPKPTETEKIKRLPSFLRMSTVNNKPRLHFVLKCEKQETKWVPKQLHCKDHQSKAQRQNNCRMIVAPSPPLSSTSCLHLVTLPLSILLCCCLNTTESASPSPPCPILSMPSSDVGRKTNESQSTTSQHEREQSLTNYPAMLSGFSQH